MPFGASKDINFDTFTKSSITVDASSADLTAAINALKAKGKAVYWEAYCYWPDNTYAAFYAPDPDLFKAALVAPALGKDSLNKDRTCTTGFVTNFKSTDKAYLVRLVSKSELLLTPSATP